ncbi:MAG TPA: hypothetical protein VK886_09930 [Vicinamibacterales bacterium]|nr:hypothetical protein [Vicinamibacterales bacterium]
MRTRTCVFCVFSVTTTLAAPRAAPAAPFQQPDLNSRPAVVVSNPVLLPISSNRTVVEFNVTNNAAQTVTAWQVTVTCLYPDGSTGGEALAVDAYEEYTGIAPARGRTIAPHSSARGRIALRPEEAARIVSMTATVDWAVFEDGSVFGDETGAQHIFDARDRDRRAWMVVIDALEAGRSADLDQRGLALALEHLNGKDQDDYDHPIKQLMRRNVQTAIEQHHKVVPKEFLDRWILRAKQRVEAFEADRRKRPSGVR